MKIYQIALADGTGACFSADGFHNYGGCLMLFEMVDRQPNYFRSWAPHAWVTIEELGSY